MTFIETFEYIKEKPGINVAYNCRFPGNTSFITFCNGLPVAVEPCSKFSWTQYAPPAPHERGSDQKFIPVRINSHGASAWDIYDIFGDWKKWEDWDSFIKHRDKR